jgi:hypothetical protein
MLRSMRSFALLAAVLAATLAAADASAASHSRVRLLTVSPLVVVGANFKAHEKIVVSVRSGPLRRSATVTSSPSGSFTWRVGASLAVPRCGVLSVSAIGSRGDKAIWESAARMCGGSLRP